MPFTGQPSDGPMGISVALTPTTHTVTVSKSMITNASFRTKKLPGAYKLFQTFQTFQTAPPLPPNKNIHTYLSNSPSSRLQSSQIICEAFLFSQDTFHFNETEPN